ncbi:homoserine O-succinyltransferase [Streptococcus merionis]|uniref:homoserine O-acetyltransferase MetA n=1 Tax=Streptococcus merionis TaxID=400065 RepID=UPI0026F07392|nr:homoserine O-succinyltransferase [Streptococcus merionis]
MPIKIDQGLPAVEVLKSENIFVMDEQRASHQDIRPLDVLIVNLMPTKIVTETQLLRLLANTPLQLNVEFLQMVSHKSKNTGAEHLSTFYKTFEQVKSHYYDGLIITGAPVENLPFEEVNYWEELGQIIEWSKSHVHSTLHICWGAQAGLYARYGVDKVRLDTKLSGIFKQRVVVPTCPLLRGFDDEFLAPHSRHTTIASEAIAHMDDLQVLAEGDEVGLSILATKDLREVYSFGHLEYDRDTLAKEYQRDLAAGLNPQVPVHYFENDNPELKPRLRWNLAAALFFSNWINYAVYQETPFDWQLAQSDPLSFSGL